MLRRWVDGLDFRRSGAGAEAGTMFVVWGELWEPWFLRSFKRTIITCSHDRNTIESRHEHYFESSFSLQCFNVQPGCEL